MARIDNEREHVALKEKKKRLEGIRALHKPLEKKDMMEHALKYEQVRLQKGLELIDKRKAELKAERMRREKLPTFKSVRSSQDGALNELRKPGQVLGVEREKAE